jgi:hypothetical protein
MGKTKEESDNNVREVLKILQKNGLAANNDKCLFNQQEITIFGLILSSEGISLNEQKTKALKNFKTPENASELHSFLGLSVYASRWINNLASIGEPLWKLTRKDVRWEWKEQHQKAFDYIKTMFIDKVSYFDAEWNTE